jgi:hypothetical protein
MEQAMLNYDFEVESNYDFEVGLEQEPRLLINFLDERG